jgi:hypothetical protein
MSTADNETVLFLRRVPTSLRDDFKAWCRRRGVSMTEQVLNLMKRCVQTAEEGERTDMAKEKMRRIKIRKARIQQEKEDALLAEQEAIAREERRTRQRLLQKQMNRKNRRQEA